jgi:predicted dehydrogenase
MATRREFLNTMAAGTAGVMIGSKAKSYARILGANDRATFAIIGLHGRGYAHLSGLKANRDVADLSHVCDVDSRELEKFSRAVQKELGQSPVPEKDFRKVLDSKDVDVITIATPDHWHAPMAILGLEAGKHVYVEKPCSHNPAEGELLIAAQRKYGKLVQMGDQQRSSPHTIQIIEKIHGGLIGRPYLAKSWYCNTRKSIGTGKPSPVPDSLDWELWQGPAPRREYRDNIHPYNWHWFWNWGTGETLNNGTHEVDVCRWALGAGYPSRLSTSGGRYHYKDDWEFYDTLVTSFEYDDKMIVWEGTCCQGKKQYGRDRGSVILGTQGAVLIDRSGYQVFTLDDKLVDDFKARENSSTADLLSRDSMTDAHFRNLVNAIRGQEKLHSPIEEGNVAVTMLHLSNIGWKVGRTLQLNPNNGHILDDVQAAAHWSREYAKGWEISV